MTMDYATFLAGKRLTVPSVGFDVPESAINPALFPFQRDIVRFWTPRARVVARLDAIARPILQRSGNI